jgi:small subunit ribosomal protein S6
VRNYELLLIVRPNLDENAVKAFIETIDTLVTNNNGQINLTNNWGRRKLAYPIDDQLEATYILYKLDLDPSAISPIEFSLKLNESLLRYMILKDHNPDVGDANDTEEAEEAASEDSEDSEESEAAAEATSEDSSETEDASADDADVDDNDDDDDDDDDDDEAETEEAAEPEAEA